MTALALLSQSRIYQWLAAIASGVLLLLSFPKFDWSFCAWIALVPLLLALRIEGQTLRKAFALGFVTGWIFFFFSANWITHSMIRYGGMNVVLAYGAAALFTAITALFPGLFALLIKHLTNRFGHWAVGLAPVIWVATEWLRGATTDITWNTLGVSQVNHFAIAHFARLGGVGLLSFSLVAVSVVLVLLPEIKKQATKRIIIWYLFLALMVYAADTLREDKATKLTPVEVAVAGVQPNLPVDILIDSNAMTERNANGLETNLQLTQAAINQATHKKADLIVWAESPLVLHYEQDEITKSKLNAIAKEHQAHLIFSALGTEGDNIYNSAQMITPDGRLLQRYDKIRLVPFGEYVPFRSILGYFVPAMIGDFTPGKAATVNALKLDAQIAVVQNEQETQGELALERTTNFVRTGTFICYEAAYPNLVRQFVNNGAALLINISDDAWFGNSAGAEQHLNHARMRAIENNRDLVRVTNSGISALITNTGQVVDPLPMFTAASRVWTAEARKGVTFYTKHGDWFAIGCAIISALAIIFSFLYHSRAPKSQL
jgi:apolipoprotein N-acyltransferase